MKTQVFYLSVRQVFQRILTGWMFILLQVPERSWVSISVTHYNGVLLSLTEPMRKFPNQSCALNCTIPCWLFPFTLQID